MKAVRDFLLLLVSLAFAGAMLAPLSLQMLPAPQETWIIQSVSELHDSFQLAPTLNGQILTNHNPLALLSLAAIPGNQPAMLRLMSLSLGLLLVYGVFVYCRRLHGAAGLLAVAVLASSLGFLKVYGTTNLTALPATLAVLSFLVFARCYLKDGRRSRYVLSYALLGLATLTGGYGYLAFGAMAMAGLLLIDLAPEKFGQIKALTGILLIAVLLLGFYAVYRLAGGPDYVGLALGAEARRGFWATLWSFVRLTLPWLPALIPAWLASVRPEQAGRWREQLPLKVGFVAGLIVLFFLPRPDSVVLCLPFAAMLVGLWIRQDLRLEKYARSNHLGLLLTGALLFAGSLVLLGLPAARKLSIGTEQAVILGLVAALTLVFVVLIRGRRYPGALASVMLAALLTSAAWGLFYLPLELRNQLDYFESLANCQPMVAFEDDLVARGYLGFVGNDPLVIKREIVPLGQPVYLTIAKPAELKKLREAAKDCKKASPWQVFENPAASQTKAVSAVSFFDKKPIYGTFRFTQPYYFRS